MGGGSGKKSKALKYRGIYGIIPKANFFASL